MIKMLLSFERGILAPNLHFSQPNPKIRPLVDGMLKVVDREIPVNKDVYGINNFGLGGSNGHMIISPNCKNGVAHMAAKMKRLAVHCGRTEEAVTFALDGLCTCPESVETQYLLQCVAQSRPEKQPFRGYTVLNGTRKNHVIQVNNPITCYYRC